MVDPPDPVTGGVRSRLSKLLSGRAKRWVIGIVLVNLIAVLVLAGIGSARVQNCNGGFSGYSGGGGGGCVADLDVNPYVVPSPAHVGQRLVYLITMRNHGPDRAFYINLTARIPKGVQIDWWMSSAGEYGGGCEYMNRVVSCFFYQDLDKGASVAATIVLVPTVPGTIRMPVHAEAEGAQDPNPHNNSITIKTNVVP